MQLCRNFVLAECKIEFDTVFRWHSRIFVSRKLKDRRRFGGYLFFLPTLREWGIAAGAANVTAFIFLVMVGANFLFELGLNLVLSPVIVRLIQYGQDRRGKK